MYVLGLTTMGESAAALLRDDEIVACAEEERFSRQKHHIGFPFESVRYCLREAGIGIGDVDHVTHYWKPWSSATASATRCPWPEGHPVLRGGRRGAHQVRGHYLPMFYMPWKVRASSAAAAFSFHYVDHHVSHAASAFSSRPSMKPRCSPSTAPERTRRSSSPTARARGSRCSGASSSSLLGQFYSAATNFLGFDMFAGDEYKVMGMAGWGEPAFYETLAREVLVRDGPGSFVLDVTFLDHHLAKHHRYGARAQKLFGPPRRPEDDVTQRHYDVAASVQKAFEETLFHLLRWLHERTGSANLCLAGGCALNSLANGKLAANTPFERFFVSPRPTTPEGRWARPCTCATACWASRGGPARCAMPTTDRLSAKPSAAPRSRRPGSRTGSSRGSVAAADRLGPGRGRDRGLVPGRMEWGRARSGTGASWPTLGTRG
jgi:carbamoyltransferase